MQDDTTQPFLAILRAELEERRLRNARYSLRAFARDLSISPSELSRVFSGKKPVSDRFLQIVLKSGQFGTDAASKLVDTFFSHRKQVILGDAFPDKPPTAYT